MRHSDPGFQVFALKALSRVPPVSTWEVAVQGTLGSSWPWLPSLARCLVTVLPPVDEPGEPEETSAQVPLC